MLNSKVNNWAVELEIFNITFEHISGVKILSDNGTEFKNRVFEDIAKKLGCEVRVYSPPY